MASVIRCTVTISNVLAPVAKIGEVGPQVYTGCIDRESVSPRMSRRPFDLVFHLRHVRHWSRQKSLLENRWMRPMLSNENVGCWKSPTSGDSGWHAGRCIIVQPQYTRQLLLAFLFDLKFVVYGEISNRENVYWMQQRGRAYAHLDAGKAQDCVNRCTHGCEWPRNMAAFVHLCIDAFACIDCGSMLNPVTTPTIATYNQLTQTRPDKSGPLLAKVHWSPYLLISSTKHLYNEPHFGIT